MMQEPFYMTDKIELLIKSYFGEDFRSIELFKDKLGIEIYKAVANERKDAWECLRHHHKTKIALAVKEEREGMKTKILHLISQIEKDEHKNPTIVKWVRSGYLLIFRELEKQERE